MESTANVNIDEETIRELGLRPSDQQINAPTAPDARVFIYPFLENVFVMESDLYGNKMPKDTCFLAFNGHHGLIGKHMNVEALKKATIKEIKDLVETHQGS